MHDCRPGLEHFMADILKGLKKRPKEIPCKYFYDKRGPALFESICRLEEYYIPSIEMSIMETNINNITAALGHNVLLIEYGSGSSNKTRVLLDHMSELAGYVPIDISMKQLKQAVSNLEANYLGLEVLPVCADYTSDFQLPVLGKEGNFRRVVYFPGSTIGNFDPDSAGRFLKHIADVVGPGGGLLLGVDLKKDPLVLNRAYNDTKGLTAAFNLNLLERINNEIGADFNIDWFEHNAFYNELEGRIEMHLMSLRDQQVRLNGTIIPFVYGENIWTESSYKYDLEQFARLAASVGFKTKCIWTDARQWFSVQYLINTGELS